MYIEADPVRANWGQNPPVASRREPSGGFITLCDEAAPSAWVTRWRSRQQR